MSRTKKNIETFEVRSDSEKIQSSLNIFNVLKQKTGLSAEDISVETGIADDVVTGYVNTCAKKQLLKITESDDKKLIKFNDDHKKILGVGFYGEACFLTAMNVGGKIADADKEKINIKAFSKLKGTRKEIQEIVSKIKNETKLLETEFCFAGVAMPDGMGKHSSRNMDTLAEGISHIFRCDVLVSPEATAAGYGEKDFARQPKEEDVLYMHLDVGAGIVIKGEMIFEADETSTSEGKTYLRPWDQFNIVSTARDLVAKGIGTSIVGMVNGDVENITLETVLDAAEKKDELAEDLVRRSGLALGVRVAYLVNMFNVGMVILGGGTEKKEGNFVQFVRQSTEKFLLEKITEELKIIPGVLGKEASSIGAASLSRQKIFMEV